MPSISPLAYQRIATYLGQEKADDVAVDVSSGEMAPEEADSWSIELERINERSRGRADVDPEDWQAFEEGWRPDNW